MTQTNDLNQSLEWFSQLQKDYAASDDYQNGGYHDLVRTV